MYNKLQVVMAAERAFRTGGTTARREEPCAWMGCFGACVPTAVPPAKPKPCERCPPRGAGKPFPAELKAALRLECDDSTAALFK